MHPGLRRLVLFRLGPVLSGLVFAAPVLVGPAIASEVGEGVPAMPWHLLPADDGDGIQQYPMDFWGRAGFEFVLRETVEGVPARDLFFRAGDGLWVGAQGGFDLDTSDLRAIVSLRLDF